MGAVTQSSYDLGGFLCGKQEPECKIFYPTKLDAGPFPIATFGHGMGGQIITDLVESVASLGFVVVAPATSGGRCDDNHWKDMLHALDGSKNNTTLHPALAHVDWNNTAIFGHSMGATRRCLQLQKQSRILSDTMSRRRWHPMAI